MEKKTRLIDKRKGKQSRKLARDKAQFINEHDDKFKRKEFTKTRTAKHNEATQAVVVKIRTPGEQDFAAENKNCGEIPEEAKTTRTARGSSTREKQNAQKANKSLSGYFATQIEDNEFTENGDIVLTAKTIRKFNKEEKRGRLPDNEIEVRSTSFYKDFDQIAAWLSAVERETLGHFQRTPARENNTHRDGGTPTNDQKNSEENAWKSSKNKGKVDDNRGFLKLPQIDDKLNCTISSRNFWRELMGSLYDLRFANLFDTITTLKLPQIPRIINSKLRASLSFL